jgi:hypothetical protein
MHGLIHLAPVQKETAHTIIYRSLEDRELFLLSQWSKAVPAEGHQIALLREQKVRDAQGVKQLVTKVDARTHADVLVR